MASQAGSQLGGVASQLGGGLQGATAGGLEGAAAAAPPLAIALAAKKLKEMVEESARATVQSLGQVATRVARLDPSVFAEGFESAADQAGIMGKVVAESSRQLRAFDGALADLSKKFAEYSGPIAQAEAMADVSQVLGDLRRANRLADAGLGDLTAARSKASQAAQDLLVTILTPAIPVMVDLLKQIAAGLEGASKGIEGTKELMPTMAEYVKAAIEFNLAKMFVLAEKVGGETATIRKRLDERKTKEITEDILGGLLDAKLPVAVGVAPPRFPDLPMR